MVIEDILSFRRIEIKKMVFFKHLVLIVGHSVLVNMQILMVRSLIIRMCILKND